MLQDSSFVLALLGIALVISALGFIRVVYFVSLGYAFAIVAMALLGLGLTWGQWTWGGALHVIGLLVWGLRLGGYIAYRERQSSYRSNRGQSDRERAEDVRGLRKVGVWLAVALLYAAMFVPAWAHLQGQAWMPPTVTAAFEGVGAAVLWLGIAIESLADWQKSAFKQANPRRFCDVGLYRWVRCPNYLGEILVWLGSLAAGAPFIHAWWAWAAAILSTVCLALIMMGSTKRLEAQQEARYGPMREYQEYVQTVPVLFPGLPIYTLKNIRVYLE